MSNELIFVVGVFWLVSATYIMYTHNKSYTLSLEIIIGAILLGPILALFVNDSENKIKKHLTPKNGDSNNVHRKWFQLNDRISRGRMHSNWFRTIPPPPPISQPLSRKPEIKKDFKFFRG